MIASEQLRPDVIEARGNFIAKQLKGVPLDKIVVLDETYATTTFTRLRGRAPRDKRLIQYVPHSHWKTLTILGAITIGGVLAASTIDDATDGEVFRGFIGDVLVPALQPGMVVVMDNLAAHKVEGIRAAIEAAGCRLVYLPPYSPDLSPIENIWSKLKQLLRTRAAREVIPLGEAIGECLREITAADCYGCFLACGYSATL